MSLSNEEVLKRINKPKNSEWIEKSIRYENRLKLHNDKVLEQQDASRYWYTFRKWFRDILPKDKSERIEQLTRFPLPTVEFTDGIFSEYSKVFDANDSLRQDKFEDAELEEDSRIYWKERAEDFLRAQSMKIMRNSINGVIVFDLPEEQETERPEPYFYFLDISNVIDIVNYKDGDCKYLIFRGKNPEDPKKDLIYYYDNEVIRVYDENTKSLINEVEHGLDWTPARQFWTSNLMIENNIMKESPISGSLTALDWLLFRELSKEYAKLYASYPIIVSIEQKCDYTDEAGRRCQDGYMVTEGQNLGGKLWRDTADPCPMCSDGRHLGPGSSVTIPAPEVGEPELKDPVRFVNNDASSIESIDKDIAIRKEQIWLNSVGKAVDMSKEAFNELQVNSAFESKAIVLMRIKKNLEIIEEFTRRTLFALRYGDEFIESIVDYGSQFFLRTVQDLLDEKKTLIDSGASVSQIKAIEEQIIETRYKNDPRTKQDLLIRMNLEPLPFYSIDKAIELREKGFLNEDDFTIKLFFEDFIEKFERENIPLVDFGSEIEFASKIKIIKEKLVEYAKGKQESPGQSGEGLRQTPD